ncbi:MAG: cytochrome c biogenesis protein CcdA [Syntrophales bacterium]|nr:cytochrome c biogenesis protein CcdA [Syntrophales bacterium]
MYKKAREKFAARKRVITPIFETINQWITGTPTVAIFGSLIWGTVSVIFSPCQIASIPLIVAYVGGQEKAVNTVTAFFHSLTFSLGLFTTISLVGIICALLGRMLGDVGNVWQIILGLVLLWVALDMFGVKACSTPNSFLYRLKLKGVTGAFILGLSYGIISGTCTFGFIAPILAIITIQKQVLTGITYIVFFALGHCLPIVAAGSSTAFVRRLIENNLWHSAGTWFRKGAATLIALLGLYFIGNPFWGA